MRDQIVKLRQQNHPIKKIARSLGISKNTVRRYLRMDEIEKQEEVKPVTTESNSDWKDKIDWEGICGKRRQGYTAKQLFSEYEPAISYSRFCAHLRAGVGRNSEIALRLNHKPGEKVQIDYCDGIPIKDRKTGKLIKTQLFVGVLPFSSYTFAMFTSNQKLASFIDAHEAMWRYFGGITPYAVVDNLKSGVKKAHRYDPEVNPTYCDYGNHRGFAVLPARPYTPRDKACVEANIGAIQRSFYQEVRDRHYYSLNELNRDLRTFLNIFNDKLMNDYGVSRSERFLVERHELHALSNEPYELAEWREAKVHPDCCIQVDKSFYSVPYKYRGQSVRVKITNNIIAIFDQEVTSIACHSRARKIGSVVTDSKHFPSQLLQAQSYDINKAKSQAKDIGPQVTEIVNKLTSDARPLRYLRRIQGLLRLKSQGLSNEALEYAASQALTFEKYQLSFIKSCAENYQTSGGRLGACCPKRDPGHIYLRGGYDV